MTDPASSAIKIQGLSKAFHSPGHGKQSKTVQALSNVSFEVPTGSVFCILGPNGAGKTTLLRILTTMSLPDTGRATVAGFDIHKQVIDVRQRIGIVAQGSNFDRYLTIWDNLVLHAQMHGLSKRDYTARINELLQQVDLYERRHDYIEQLSGGMQRRVAVIRALIHKPSVLFLDEPSTGLDPEARREIWHTIEQFKTWATVILTTHYMEEADVLSDHVLILNHGTVVMRGTPAELKKALSPANTFDIIFHENRAELYQQQLSAKGYSDIQHLTRNHLRITLANHQSLKTLLDELDWADIHQVGETEADLEAVYLAAASRVKIEQPVLVGDT